MEKRMRERTFTRDGKTVTTSTPSAATQLKAEGWREEGTWPTERPEPAHRFERENGEIVDEPTGIPTVDQDSRLAGRRRKAATETQSNPPAPTE
jgi:hypothetical protein